MKTETGITLEGKAVEIIQNSICILNSFKDDKEKYLQYAPQVFDLLTKYLSDPAFFI